MTRGYRGLGLMLVAFTIVTPSLGATQNANPLKSVSLGARSHAVHVTFRLPSSMTPYTLHLDAPKTGQGSPDHELFFILPAIPSGNENSTGTRWNFGVTTATSWTSIPIIGKILQSLGGARFAVRLYYAPKTTCRGIGRCTGIRHSPPLFLQVTDQSGPGLLIARSSSSGQYAATTVSGSVSAPDTATFIIRVKSAPTAQNVHVDWALTCADGTSVKETSGGFDDTTPVNDAGIDIYKPFLNPDDCSVSVEAQLTDGDGTISLAVFGSQY